MTDEAIEDTLEKVVKLLAYISDKDLFAEFYRKKLARRLLQDRSSNDEHERSILSRLKQQCGAQFTSKVPLHLLITYSCCLLSKVLSSQTQMTGLAGAYWQAVGSILHCRQLWLLVCTLPLQLYSTT